MEIKEDSTNNIEEIGREIKKGYTLADFKILLQTQIIFEKLDFPDEEWKGIIENLKIYKFPGNLKASDIIWGLAISTKYLNPLSRYYLAWSLGTLDDDGCNDRAPFITNLYTEAFRIFEESFEDNPEVCYILGINHGTYSFKIGIKHFDINKAVKYHWIGANKLNDPRNKLKFLNMKRERVDIPVEVYLKIAESYPPAYLEVSELEEDINRKIGYLKECTTLNGDFPHGFIKIGEIYENQDDDDQAIQNYYKAAAQGLSTGYILIAKTIIGDLNSKKSREIKINDALNFSDENVIEIVENNLIKATFDLNDPEACKQLIALYEGLFRIDNYDDSSPYGPKLRNSLLKGMQLGLCRPYYKFYRYNEREKYEKLVNIFGVNPHNGLMKSIEEFLLCGSFLQGLFNKLPSPNSQMQPLLHWTFTRLNWWYIVVAKYKLVNFTLEVLPDGVQVNWKSEPKEILHSFKEDGAYVEPLHGTYIIKSPQPIEHIPCFIQKLRSSLYKIIKVPFVTDPRVKMINKLYIL